MDNSDIVRKMISLSEKIQSYISGLDYDAFLRQDMIVEACAFSLICPAK